MKLLAAGILTTFAITSFAVAQDHPRSEIFAGYSLEHIAPCGTTTTSGQGSACGLESGELQSSVTNYNGWNASITGYVNRFVGFTADFGGHYGTTVASSTSRYSFLFGPTFVFRTPKLTPFAHVLIGGLHQNVSQDALFNSTRRAIAVGGGLDLNASKRFAVRLGQFDYEWVSIPTPNLPAATGFRFSAGVVFKF